MEFYAEIDMQFDGVTWDTIASEDVLIGDSQIRWTRGITGNRPTDNVASTGTLEFVLRNDDGNSAGIQGWYSPNHPDCRDGFGFGTSVRLRYIVDGVSTVMWTGKLRVIAPVPGLDGNQTTACLAHDVMGDFADTDIREVSPQINQADDDLIQEIIDSMPDDSQPVAVLLDEGLDVFPVAFDDLGEGTKGLTVLERVATSAQAKIWVSGDGTFRYQNRVSEALQVAQFTLTDTVLTALDVPTDLGNVFNRVRMVTHAKTFSATPIVLATHLSQMAIEPGDSTEVWLTYQDPERPEVKLGGTDFITPVATTDYLFNTAADGSGTNVTAQMTVTASFFATTVKLTVTNTGAETAYERLLQVRGTGIYDNAPAVRESYSPEPYGNRPITIDLPYQDDDDAAAIRGATLHAAYRDLRRHVNACQYEATESDSLMQQAVRRDIGDAIGVSETIALPDPVTLFIQSIEGVIQGGPIVSCRYGLAPRIVEDEYQKDRIRVKRDALLGGAHAPETRIGFARIGLSEIGPISPGVIAPVDTTAGRFRGLLILTNMQQP